MRLRHGFALDIMEDPAQIRSSLCHMEGIQVMTRDFSQLSLKFGCVTPAWRWGVLQFKPHGSASMVSRSLHHHLSCFMVVIFVHIRWRLTPVYPTFNIKGPTVNFCDTRHLFFPPRSNQIPQDSERMAVPATMDPNSPLHNTYAEAFNSNSWPTLNLLGLARFISEPPRARFCMGFASFKLSYISGVCSDFLYLLRF